MPISPTLNWEGGTEECFLEFEFFLSFFLFLLFAFLLVLVNLGFNVFEEFFDGD